MHLHGNTQQKTLGARISEDIITLRDEASSSEQRQVGSFYESS